MDRATAPCFSGPILSEPEAFKGLSDTRASYTSSSDITISLRHLDGGERGLIVVVG